MICWQHLDYAYPGLLMQPNPQPLDSFVDAPPPTTTPRSELLPPVGDQAQLGWNG